MEQTPALAKAIAQGMGITVGQLRSVAAEGKITSKEIVKALKMPKTMWMHFSLKLILQLVNHSHF